MCSFLLQPFTGSRWLPVSWTKALSFHMQVDGQGSPRQTTVYAHSYRQNPFNDYKVKCLMNTGNESELPNQTVTLFDWSLKKHAVMFSWWKILHFLLANSRRFLLSAVFRWSNLKQYLLELIVFLEGAPNGELPSSPPCTHITLFGWRPAFGVIGRGSFLLHHSHFRSTLLYSIHFPSLVTICFKNGTFSLCFSRESHVEIRPRRVFFFVFI